MSVFLADSPLRSQITDSTKITRNLFCSYGLSKCDRWAIQNCVFSKCYLVAHSQFHADSYSSQFFSLFVFCNARPVPSFPQPLPPFLSYTTCQSSSLSPNPRISILHAWVPRTEIRSPPPAATLFRVSRSFASLLGCISGPETDRQ